MSVGQEDFKRSGYEVIDWINDYLSHPERYAVLSLVKPGEIKNQLPQSPPEQPEAMETILKDVERIIAPGLTHWNHPGFMAYFAITASKPAILGELLSAAFNNNAMMWKTGPAATELEEVVLDWLRQLLGLPKGLFGIINDTASVSSLVALVAAREALDLKIRERGMAGRAELSRLRLYTSEQAHSSIEKAAIVVGIGQEGVRKISVDDDYRMRADALQKAIEQDLAAGVKPFCVVATVGTTSTTSIDPVAEIARVCQKYKLWLHVDAAYAGSAAILPEMREVLDGCDKADSIVVNPHKWLFVPVDCSVLYCRRPEILRRAFSLMPEYLETSEQDTVTNYMDFGIALGRRFRSLKLWMTIRAFGVEGLREHLRLHIQLAQKFRSWIEEHPDFELLAPTPFSVVCFRFRPRDISLNAQDLEAYLNRINEALLDAVNKTGEIYLSHTKLNGKFTIRLAIGNIRTTEAHVQRAWELLKHHAIRLHSKMRPVRVKIG